MNPERGARLLLAGASARALARSALAGPITRARFPGGMIVLDFFGDADLAGEPGAMVLSLGRDFGLPRTTAGLGRAALALGSAASGPAAGAGGTPGGRGWDGLAFSGGLENRPGLLRRLARVAPLLGSDPMAVAAVRDPDRLFPLLDREGILRPETPSLDEAPRDGRRWLFKRRRGAGGRGVRPAAPGERRRPGEYLQQRLEGPPGSIAFVADGRRARMLGATRQLTGGGPAGPAAAPPGAPDAAAPFRYAGNIAGPWEALLTPSDRAALQRAADILAARFSLRGLNGCDYILTPDGPALLEINPRFTASMELLEEMACESFFDRHLGALDGSVDPAPGDGAAGARGAGGEPPAWMGKGILYADRAVAAPEPETLAALGARDRPRPGERFEPGQPLCTLIVAGRDEEDCRRALAARADAARARFAPVADDEPERTRETSSDRVIRSEASLFERTNPPWQKPARPW